MHYIEVENLTFYYDDEPVLEDVSYYVDPGEFVILTGENGAAKSARQRLDKTTQYKQAGLKMVAYAN